MIGIRSSLVVLAALFASMPMGIAPMRIAWAAIGDPAGVAGAVAGNVGLVSPAKAIASPIAVQSGDGILMGDGLTTSAASRLQIMLLDQSAITLGPDAELTIDEFVFDPASADANLLSASLAKGIFRLVTGGIARANPDGTQLKLPSATLSVRGTTTTGKCDASGCLIALSGTGNANNAGKKPSRVLVSSAKGKVELKRAGFFVFIGPDGTISEPRRMGRSEDDAFAPLFAPLPIEPQGSLDLGSIIEASGQPTQDGRPPAEDLGLIDAVASVSEPGLASTTNNLPLGTVHFFNIVPIDYGATEGTYTVDLFLDLGARSSGGTLTVVDSSYLSATFIVPLTVDPFLSNFSVTETGAVPGNIFLDDTYKLGYQVTSGGLTTQFAIDPDGPGVIPSKNGAGLVPLVP
jgi:FecR protein